MKLLRTTIKIAGLVTLLRLLVSCDTPGFTPTDPAMRDYSPTERFLIGLSRAVETPKLITLEDQVRACH